MYKASYSDYQNESMMKILSPNSTSVVKITFEVPLSYKDNFDLVFEGKNSNDKNIIRFDMQ